MVSPLNEHRVCMSARVSCIPAAISAKEFRLCMRLRSVSMTWPKCKKKCGRRAKTKRSTLCSTCFLKKAADSGSRSIGNTKMGAVKKQAGKRSGLKRCAKCALVVKKRWLDLIMAGTKDWEIRGHSTTRRGWIHFAESQAGGKLVGRANLIDCLDVPRASFMQNINHHRVASLSAVPYKRIYAWVLKDAERYSRPLSYEHKLGAVIWALTTPAPTMADHSAATDDADSE